MNFITVGVSDIGAKRKTNQDNLLIRHTKVQGKDNILAVMCDGMGGLSKGEVASAMVTGKFSEWFDEKIMWRDSSSDLETILIEMQNLLENASRDIFLWSQQENIRMGTTASAVFVSGVDFVFIHIGDSRIYQIGKTVQQLTEDHSLTARDVRSGIITAEQARTDRRRNQLYKCVGVTENIEPQSGKGHLQKGEGFLLCCDGLWHKAERREIQNLFSKKYRTEVSLKRQMQKMIHFVIERGEKDNISAIAILPMASEYGVKACGFHLFFIILVIMLILIGWMFI